MDGNELPRRGAAVYFHQASAVDQDQDAVVRSSRHASQTHIEAPGVGLDHVHPWHPPQDLRQGRDASGGDLVGGEDIHGGGRILDGLLAPGSRLDHGRGQEIAKIQLGDVLDLGRRGIIPIRLSMRFARCRPEKP